MKSVGQTIYEGAWKSKNIRLTRGSQNTLLISGGIIIAAAILANQIEHAAQPRNRIHKK